MSTKPQKYDGRCHAKRRDGQPCNKAPIKGGVVCWKHGGNLPRVRQAAEQRLAEARKVAKFKKRMRALYPDDPRYQEDR